MDQTGDEGANPLAHSENNFDFLRVLAALSVLVSHQFAVTGQREPTIVPFHSMGGFGVLVFFTISGYLVSASWNRDPHALRFAARRILRIWPAWIVVTALSVLALGPAVTALPVADYLRDPDTWKYFRQLLLSEQYYLPGVFERTPLPRAVNGSLWTLPIEVEWYGFLLLAGLAGILRRRWLLVSLVVAFAVYAYGIHDVEHNRRWKWEFGLFFCAGSCLYLFRDHWVPHRAVALVASLAAGTLLWSAGHRYAGLFVFMPLLVIMVGTAAWPVARRFGRFGDLSYGLYIYAFPVQQTVIWAVGGTLSVVKGGLITLAVTTALSFVSWHLVEKPSLRLKRGFPRKRPADAVAYAPRTSQ